MALLGTEDLISSSPFQPACQWFWETILLPLRVFFPLDKCLSSGPGHKPLTPYSASLHCRFKDESHGYREGSYTSVSTRESERLSWDGKIWKVLDTVNNTDRDP